jgi:uncharacterized protein YlxW (UPF0749 family)
MFVNIQWNLKLEQSKGGQAVSDTPRTDKVLYSVDVCDGEDVVNIEFARTLERELNAANAEIERLTNKVAQLYEGAEEAKQRIKRLEEALDTLTLVVGLTPIRGNLAALQEAMDESRAVLKAKEDKP